MLWIAGGAALLLYLAGRKISDAVGGAVDVVAKLPEKIKQLDTAKKKEIIDSYKVQFLMNVKALTGVIPVGAEEEKLCMSYMPYDLIQDLDGMPVVGLWAAGKAYAAGNAVKDYRQNKGKAPIKHWYDIF
ncbi:hypothetical protein [Janthinobacterium sp. B9-8]|uniref:hypothetical protein n=1 Tax=Janthinobacterium sp. B9-8 TaxID=1236179 RepID=UPI0012E3A3B4|nr:hypothetical protein [Janthinobacterium sp. B9-8]